MDDFELVNNDPVQLVETINRVAMQLHNELMELQSGDSISIRPSRFYKRQIEEWTAYLVEHYDVLSRFHNDLDDDGTRYNYAIHIYMEIARMIVISEWDQFQEWGDWRPSDPLLLKTLPFPMDPSGKALLPPTLYTQSQIMVFMEHLVARIDSLPYSDDLHKLLSALEIKNSMIFCQAFTSATLDVPHMRTPVATTITIDDDDGEISSLEDNDKGKEEEDSIQSEDEGESVDEGEEPTHWTLNRDYWVWSTIYFVQVCRKRLYYTHLIPEMPFYETDEFEEHIEEGAEDRMEEWCRQLLSGAGDQFEEIFDILVDEAYNLPGDREWYAYSLPKEPKTRNNIMFQLHRHSQDSENDYYSEYRTTSNISATNALDSVRNKEGNNRSSTLLVLELVGRYFQMHHSISWRDGYVIEYDQLEQCVEKQINSGTEPLLVRYTSGEYCVMVGGRVLRSQHIYKSLCLWLSVVKVLCPGCKIFGQSVYIGNIVDRILINRPRQKRKRQQQVVITI